MKEKISYERRDYEKVADSPQSKSISEKISQILSLVARSYELLEH